MAITLDSNIAKFDVNGEVTSLAPRWTRWKRAFEYYIVGKGVTDAKQKKALLLHFAGLEVQDIYETLTDPGVPSGGADTADEYGKVIRTLDSYFKPQANIPYERHVFRQMKQEPNETIDQFVGRLKRQAENCGFEDRQSEQIRDQVIDKCRLK